MAAAAIYMASQASDDKRTQREIADVAGVADVTIRQSYKLMLPRLMVLLLLLRTMRRQWLWVIMLPRRGCGTGGGEGVGTGPQAGARTVSRSTE